MRSTLLCFPMLACLSLACSSDKNSATATDGGSNNQTGSDGSSPSDAADSRISDRAPDGGGSDVSAHEGGAVDGAIGSCSVPADCPGGTCWQFPDGHRACVKPQEVALESCPKDPIGTCCQNHAACNQGSGGRCVPNGYGYCGGVAPPPGNGCRYNECSRDDECVKSAAPHASCVPAGAYGLVNSRCVYGSCRVDGDCQQKPGGHCLVQLGFCGLVGTLFCGYDGDPCTKDADCPPDKSNQRQICVARLDLQGRECRPEPPPAP